MTPAGPGPGFDGGGGGGGGGSHEDGTDGVIPQGEGLLRSEAALAADGADSAAAAGQASRGSYTSQGQASPSPVANRAPWRTAADGGVWDGLSQVKNIYGSLL